MSGFEVVGTTLGVTAGAMLAMWLLSLALKDASTFPKTENRFARAPVVIGCKEDRVFRPVGP